MFPAKTDSLAASCLAIIGLTAVPMTAAAQTTPFVDAFLIRDGNDAGEYRRDEDGRDRPDQAVYPGGEQAQLAQLATGEILIFGMGSYRLNGELPRHRVQLFCASVTMDPVSGPQLQSLQYVTDNDGNRYRNSHHPRVTRIFGGDAVAVTYNYAPNNLAYAYQTVFGSNCQQLSERTRIMAKDNDNCSETGESPEMVLSQTATTARLFSAHGCNGNGSDDSWAAVTEIVKTDEQPYPYRVDLITQDIRTEREEERTRPDVIPTGIPDLGVVCLTAGNTQPPNRGVYCSGYDTNTGEQLWRTAVAEKEDGLYRTQIRANPILTATGEPTGSAYVIWRELTPRLGKRGKGAAKLVSAAIRFDREGMTMLTAKQYDMFAGGEASHPSMCSTLWGVDGQDVSSQAFVISGSINGSPAALSTAYLIGHDAVTQKLIATRKVGLNSSIDTGWLSNLYGENPRNQGRNFIKCIGNVANPGYGVEGGYQSGVKSFVAVAAHTRRMDLATGMAEEKLATELVLVPAVRAPETPPLPDASDDDTGNDGDDTDDGGGGSETNPGAGPEMSSPSGLGCSVSTSSSDLRLFALLGLALLAIRRHNSHRR